MTEPSPGIDGPPPAAAAPSASPEATARLRKADVFTGIVLAAVAAAMVAEALTFPLEGTYAGVRNAWYVSPALFPLIVGGMLFILSAGLVGTALRDFRRLSPGGRLFSVDWAASLAEGRDAWLVANLLSAYIVGLVPRIDFPAATALFLVVFMGVYVVTAPRGRIALVALLVGPAAAALAAALAGVWPEPRSGGQFAIDGLLALVLAAAVAVAALAASPAERPRLVPAVLTSVLGAGILSAVFKYGLLVPLPREGLFTFLMDGVARGLSRLLG